MFEKKKDFLINLGANLHSCGASADEVEEFTQSVSKKLDIETSLLCTPNFMMYSFKNNDSESFYIEKLPFPIIHLKKLVLIETLINEFLAKKISLEDIISKLKIIRKLKLNTSYPALILSYGLLSCSSCIFLGGTLRDCLVSFFLGCFTGLFSLLEFFPIVSIFYQAIISFFMTTMIFLLQKYFIVINPGIISIASLIGLFPGLGITLSVTELAKQHLLSGIMRLMNAITTLFMLVFGSFLATNFFKISFFTPKYILHPISLQLLFALIAGLASNRIFRGRYQDIPIMIASCLLSFMSSKLLPFNAFLNIFCTGIFISFYSQIFSIVFKRPYLVCILPSILLLLPGTLSFKITNDLFLGNFQGVLEQGVLLFLTLSSLVFGLLVGQFFTIFKKYVQ